MLNFAETISFVVNEDGTVTAINSGKVSADGKTLIMEDTSNTIREMFNLSVSIEKKWTDIEGRDADWPEGASAEFTLEYYDNVEKKWFTYAPYGTPVTVTLTAEHPLAVFEELPAKIDGNNAQYRAVETKIEGYTQATSTVADPGNYIGTMTAVNTPEVPDEFEVYISKNSLGGAEIPGAHIVIYDASGSTVDEWDSTTKAHSVMLKPGSYTMVETDANHLILEDAPEIREHEVKISKTDLGGTELEGAHMVLKDDKGNVVAEWNSTKEAYTVFLTAGNYVMAETIAPNGYQRITTEVTFTVYDDGKVTLLTATVDNGGQICLCNGQHCHF